MSKQDAAFHDVISYIVQAPSRRRKVLESDFHGDDEVLNKQSPLKKTVAKHSSPTQIANNETSGITPCKCVELGSASLQRAPSPRKRSRDATLQRVDIEHGGDRRRKISRPSRSAAWDRVTEEYRSLDVQSSQSAMNTSHIEENQNASTLLKDVQSMALLLGNELQPLYDPRAGSELIKNGVRHRSDHVGRPIKTGSYTKEEHTILKEALRNYFKSNGWDEKEGWEAVSAFGEGTGKTEKQRDVAEARHWETIAASLPQRSVRSVQLYAHRRLYPWKTGPWTVEEEKDLVELVSQYGCVWTKLAYEYFHRPPNYIRSKWKDLEPRVAHHQSLRRSERHVWTKEEDIQLLTAIKLVTGVTLPYRAIPWAEVQRHMPSFSATALAWRYKNTLFRLILAGKYKGADERVLLRQFLRYVHRSLEAGLIKDLSEVEAHRVIPFWYSSNHIRRMTRFLKARCPPEVQHASLQEQVEFMYKLLKCEKKERHDLRRLARTFRTLQELNGVSVVPAVSGILSERFPPSTPAKQPTSLPQLFKTVDTTPHRHELPSTLHRPLTASEHKTKKVVPSHLQHLPYAFPINLEAKKRRRRQCNGNQDADAEQAVSDTSSNTTSSFLVSSTKSDSLPNADRAEIQHTSSNTKPFPNTQQDDPIHKQYLDALEHIQRHCAEASSDSFSSSDEDDDASPVVTVGQRRLRKKDHPWMSLSA